MLRKRGRDEQDSEAGCLTREGPPSRRQGQTLKSAGRSRLWPREVAAGWDGGGPWRVEGKGAACAGQDGGRTSFWRREEGVLAGVRESCQMPLVQGWVEGLRDAPWLLWRKDARRPSREGRVRRTWSQAGPGRTRPKGSRV